MVVCVLRIETTNLVEYGILRNGEYDEKFWGKKGKEMQQLHAKIHI